MFVLDLCGIMFVMYDFGGLVGMGLVLWYLDCIWCIVSVNGLMLFG